MAPQAKKKIGYGVKMLVYNHTVTQQTLFCGAKKENGAAGKKKLRGTAHLQAQRAKILRFHHSSHLGDLGARGRGPPKVPKNPLFFFFFFFFSRVGKDLFFFFFFREKKSSSPEKKKKKRFLGEKKKEKRFENPGKILKKS